jgi:hypothetical protein
MSALKKERIFLSDKDSVTVNENNLVNLILSSGEVIEKLEPRRLFPVSRVNSYITLLDSDGKEAAVIRNISDLSPSSREVIEYSLNDYYLVPHIKRILSITEKNGKIHWTVETERGLKEFDIHNRNHDIRVYPDGRVRVRDSDDNRYIITDYRALDKRSQRQLIADL